jgi:hypothetical protein
MRIEAPRRGALGENLTQILRPESAGEQRGK